MDILRRTAASLHRHLAPPLFVIEIRGGAARTRRGDVPPALVGGVSDVARDLGLRNGTVYGVRRAQGLSLSFSDDIPEHAHQRLRNVLATQRQRIPGA